jgi:hypothetical protein
MSTPAQIRRRRATIKKRFLILCAAEDALQAECAHPNASKQYGASTGNYDPSADSYWIDWDCPDCGKHWTTPQ